MPSTAGMSPRRSDKRDGVYSSTWYIISITNWVRTLHITIYLVCYLDPSSSSCPISNRGLAASTSTRHGFSAHYRCAHYNSCRFRLSVSNAGILGHTAVPHVRTRHRYSIPGINATTWLAICLECYCSSHIVYQQLPVVVYCSIAISAIHIKEPLRPFLSWLRWFLNGNLPGVYFSLWAKATLFPAYTRHI